MPTKMKVGLAAIGGVIAVFSVYQLSRYLHTLAMNGPTLAVESPQPDTINCATCDPDHDGLTNAEEAYWGTDPLNPDSNGDGFKDGEEVAAGRNPLTGQSFNTGNLTDQLSQLTFSGLAAGALNPASDSYDQALTDISASIADSGKYVFGKQLSTDSINTISGGKGADLAYFNALTPLTSKLGSLLQDQYLTLNDNLNTVGASGFTAEIKNYYASQATAYQSLFDTGSTMNVPEDLKSQHAQLLMLIQKLHDISAALATGDQDPVKAALALNAFGDVYNQSAAVAEGFLDQIKTISSQ